MRTNDDMKVAGELTARQWRELSARLDRAGRLPDEGHDDWLKAVDVIRVRMRTRFVEPIESLRSFEYAGFLVVAIDSLLAEAIQRVRKGWRLQQNKSSELVVTFLRERPSFDGKFRSDTHVLPCRTCPCIACDFYRSVRSGIVHEGETQNGWIIRFGERVLLRVEGDRRILDRNRFHDAVVSELHEYLKELMKPGESDLRRNLRNTLDAICAPTAIT